MKELIPKLQEADTAYFKLDAPIMTDLEYDRLYDELKRLEQESGIILAASPTRRAPGEVLEGLTAVTAAGAATWYSRLTRVLIRLMISGM